MAAVPGQSVAVALMAAGVTTLRSSLVERAPRGAFCLTGVCQECVVRIGAGSALACQTPVRDGMAVGLDAPGA